MKRPQLLAEVPRVRNRRILQVTALLAGGYVWSRTYGPDTAPEPLPLGSEPVRARSMETG